MLKLNVINETKVKVSKKIFEDIFKKFNKVLKTKIDKKLGKLTGFVDMVLNDDKAIQALNREYREKDEPTDVIAFAYLEVTDYKREKKGDIIAGDIFVSVDTAKRQAKERGETLKSELETLFTHGLLHLIGFDHKTKKQETEMEKWAKKVL